MGPINVLSLALIRRQRLNFVHQARAQQLISSFRREVHVFIYDCFRGFFVLQDETCFRAVANCSLIRGKCEATTLILQIGGAHRAKKG